MADCWLKEKPQLAPYTMATLTMLYQNFNIHCHYSNFLSALRSFVILNLPQYTLRTPLLMSGKAYLFLLYHTFKVILDTKKKITQKELKFCTDSSWRPKAVLLAFLSL